MALFDNRKGLTPLVATILLVAFSIGLGALVMSWGEEYIEEKAEFVQGTAEVRSGCDVSEISIIKISGQPQACVSPEGIKIWIDNGPEMDLVNLHARIAGTNGVDVIDSLLTQPLLKANAINTVIPYNKEIGQVLQVKLTPKIWTGSQVAICSQRAIELEDLPSC